MHSVFSAQTRRFGHSHSFDSQIGNTDVSLALGNGEVAAAANIRSEESICQTRRFAPTVGQSMSVTGISRQAQRNCFVDKSLLLTKGARHHWPENIPEAKRRGRSCGVRRF
jgi:hypothetical protein